MRAARNDDKRTDLEQAQSLDCVQFVELEAVVDAGRYDHWQQISRKDVNADPVVRGMFWMLGTFMIVATSQKSSQKYRHCQCMLQLPRMANAQPRVGWHIATPSMASYCKPF
jgi:hypothetical protein